MTQRLKVGRGGWTCWLSDDFPVPVYLRFAEQGGALAVVELYLVDDDGISAGALRQVPLGNLEARVNADAGLAKSVRDQLDLPGLDFRRAAPYYGANFGPQASGHWVQQMFDAQREDSPWPQAPTKPPPSLRAGRPAELEPPAVRLVPPTAGGRTSYGPGFYKQVAEAYRLVLSVGKRPAPTIAEASGVPVTTVHRWVKEARRQGFLPPARAGKAG